MASPQIEDGYTRIANELLDALARVRIPGEAMQVLWAVIRRTYGYGRKADRISLGEFESATGIRRSHVSRALRVLMDMGLLNIDEAGDKKTATKWSVNKDYDSWGYPKNGATPNLGASPEKGDTPSPNLGATSVPNIGATPSPENGATHTPQTRASAGLPATERNKDKRKKEIKAKESTSTGEIAPQFFTFATDFLTYQHKQHPTQVKATDLKPSKIKSNADALDKLVRIDGHDFETEIRPALQWAVKNDFWGQHIYSLAGLRNTSRRNGRTKFQNLLASFAQEQQAGQPKPGTEPNLQPRTYAQVQDLERRSIARQILEATRAQRENNHAGAAQAQPATLAITGQNTGRATGHDRNADGGLGGLGRSEVLPGGQSIPEVLTLDADRGGPDSGGCGFTQAR